MGRSWKDLHYYLREWGSLLYYRKAICFTCCYCSESLSRANVSTWNCQHEPIEFIYSLRFVLCLLSSSRGLTESFAILIIQFGFYFRFRKGCSLCCYLYFSLLLRLWDSSWAHLFLCLDHWRIQHRNLNFMLTRIYYGSFSKLC